jgi:hypothetical protein
MRGGAWQGNIICVEVGGGLGLQAIAECCKKASVTQSCLSRLLLLDGVLLHDTEKHHSQQHKPNR